MDTWNNKADETLVALYAKGENQAFNVLLNRYKDKLYTYIYYIVRNSEMTEDIFQETFMKAIITIRQGRYNENGKFSAWLRRIAHNLIIDSFRQEKSENLVSCDEPEVNILNNVRRLMEFLPDEQREVVYMRFYQDLSFKEIAEQTGVSINTSLGRMRYAILNLRRMAEKNGVVLTVD